MKEVNIMDMRSWWFIRDMEHEENRDRYYKYLHPEFVSPDGKFKVCSLCKTQLDRDGTPETSIPMFDYGDADRIGATAPSLMELLSFALMRPYIYVLKIRNTMRPNDERQHTLKANTICYTHDAADIMVKNLLDSILSASGLLETMQLQFVGSKGEVDFLASKCYGSSIMTMRAWVIVQWCKILPFCNPHPGYSQYRSVVDQEFTIDNVQHAINVAKEQLAKRALRTTDEDLRDTDTAICDDIQNTRQINNPNESSNSSNSNNIFYVQPMEGPASLSDPDEHRIDVVSHQTSVIFRNTSTIPQTPDEATHVLLSSFSNSVGIDATLPVSKRDKDPVNSYTASDSPLLLSFPTVFLFGEKSKKLGTSVSCKHVNHLMRQFTNNAATNVQLQAYIFAEMRKRSNAIGVSWKLKSDGVSMAKMKDMLSDRRKLKTDLEDAMKHPKSKNAKDLAQTICSIATSAQTNTTFGHFERRNAINEIMAYTKTFGPPYAYVTVTFNDIDEPHVYRLSFRSFDNDSFPSIATEKYYDDLANGRVHEAYNSKYVAAPLLVDTSKKHRSVRITQTPVASSSEYSQFISNIYNILLGARHTTHTRHSPKRLQKGIFGHCVAVFSVNETQARGALHHHLVLWGGVPPLLMQRAATFPPQEWAAFARILDSQFTCEVDPKFHKLNLGRNIMCTTLGAKRVPPPPVAFEVPLFHQTNINVTNESISNLVGKSVARTNVHTHSFTCAKHGRMYCRMCYPQPLENCTQPIQIEYSLDSAGRKILNKRKTFLVQKKEMVDSPLYTGDVNAQLIPDKRPINWVLKRSKIGVEDEVFKLLDDPETSYESFAQCVKQWLKSCCDEGFVWNAEMDYKFSNLTFEEMKEVIHDLKNMIELANTNVVTYNKLLVCATKCNCAVYQLTNEQNSINAMIYIGPYLVKGKYDLQEHLSTMHTALRLHKRFESAADDKDTLERHALKFTQTFTNRTDFMEEVSDTQIAGALIGLPSMHKTRKTVWVGIHESLEFMRAMQDNALLSRNATITNDNSDHNTGNDVPDESTDTSAHHTAATRDIRSLLMVNDNDDSIVEEEVTANDDFVDCDDNIVDINPTVNSFITLEDLQQLQNDSRNREDIIANDTVLEDDDEVVDTSSLRQNMNALNHVSECLLNEIQTDQLDEMHRTIDLNRLLSLSTQSSQIKYKLGRIRLYKVADDADGIIVPVHPAMHYFFRGHELKHLNQDEYISTIAVVVKKNSTNEGNGKAFKTFSFAPGHPLFASHNQRIRSKFCIQKLVGRQPPLPGIEPEQTEPEKKKKQWKARADKFASFWLIWSRCDPCFEGVPCLTTTYDWEAFVSYWASLKSSTRLVDHCRYVSLRNGIKSFRVTNHVREMLNEYRAKEVTLWTKEEQRKFCKRDYQWKSDHDYMQQLEAMKEDQSQDGLKVQDIASLQKCSARRTKMSSMIESIVKHYNTLYSGEDAFPTHVPEPFGMCYDEETMNQSVVDTARNVKEYKRTHNDSSIGTEDDCEAESSDHGEEDHQEDVRTCIADFEEKLHDFETKDTFTEMTQDKKKHFKTITRAILKAYLYKKCKKTAVDEYYIRERIAGTGDGTSDNVFWITGPPGTGKTHLTKAITLFIESSGLGNVQNVSFQGVTAMLMLGGGQTISSLFKIARQASKRKNEVETDSTIKELSISALEQLMGTIGMHCLIMFNIDEISQVAALHLSYTDARMRQCTGKMNLPFGGILTTMCGDFKQLASINRSVPSAWNEIVNNSGVVPVNSPQFNAVQLFMQHTHVMNLTEQNRASGPHAEYITSMWHGIDITIEDLKSRYDTFDPIRDVDQSPSWIDESVVLVTTNEERIEFNYHFMMAFAGRNNLPVVRWKLPESHIRYPHNFNNKQTRDILREIDDHVLYEFFVQSAVGYVTNNINTSLGIANGSPIRYHSITFLSSDQKEEFDRGMRQWQQDPKIHKFITLTEAPKSINVELYPEIEGLDEHTNNMYKEKWTTEETLHHLCVPGKIVIPMLITKPGSTSNNWYPTTTHVSGCHALTIQIRCSFDVELRFAMTVNKSQGATLGKILISMPNRDNASMNGLLYSYEKLFVAMSRAKEAKNIRFIQPWDDLYHLQSLHQNEINERFITSVQDLHESRIRVGNI